MKWSNDGIINKIMKKYAEQMNHEDIWKYLQYEKQRSDFNWIAQYIMDSTTESFEISKTGVDSILKYLLDEKTNHRFSGETSIWKILSDKNPQDYFIPKYFISYLMMCRRDFKRASRSKFSFEEYRRIFP